MPHMYLGRRRASGFFGVLKEGCIVIKGYAIAILRNNVTNVEVQAELEELEEAEEQEEALALKETNMENITLELEEELHICEEDETVK